MIERKINILSGLYERKPTDQEKVTLGARRTKFFLFTADVRFTRSEIYYKVIDKIRTDHLATKSLGSLTLELLRINNTDAGYDRMNGYLSEIKQAILSNDPNLLGEDYHGNQMNELILKLRQMLEKNDKLQKTAERITLCSQTLCNFGRVISKACNTLKGWNLKLAFGSEIDSLHALIGQIGDFKPTQFA